MEPSPTIIGEVARLGRNLPALPGSAVQTGFVRPEVRQMRQSLCCAASWGYGWKEIRVWAHSLWRAKVDARKIVFLRDTSPIVFKELANLGIETVAWKVRESRLHPITTRWEPILDHLLANDYEYVVCTDLKDCVYQRDPIPWLRKTNEPLVLATESIPNAAPGQDNFNWMTDYLKDRPEELNKMAEREVVCGGTITGKHGAVTALLYDMYEILRKHSNPRLIDQCVLNHLAHTSYSRSCYIPRLSDGFILSGNFCWNSPMDDPPWTRNGVAYPHNQDKPFHLYHLYFPHDRASVTRRYWCREWDGTCHRCGGMEWGPITFYGPTCKKCGNRYMVPKNDLSRTQIPKF